MSRPRKGDRVRTKFGEGYIADDYWAHRDRYMVQYDDGSESDHGEESITILRAKPLTSNKEGTQ